MQKKYRSRDKCHLRNVTFREDKCLIVAFENEALFPATVTPPAKRRGARRGEKVSKGKDAETKRNGEFQAPTSHGTLHRDLWESAPFKARTTDRATEAQGRVQGRAQGMAWGRARGSPGKPGESDAGYDLPHGWIYNHQAAPLNRHEAIARCHLAAPAVVPIDRDRRPLNVLQLANGPGLGRGAAFAAGSPSSGPQASAAGKL
ncbi:hypothetical protein I7I51_07200 [Histoplasma capsulatum]|uniref:Uncharacterized protein n=1 Tax=Ajellomyces capsulatus TaxID=5037 RepID=A0A8A1MNZ0_AJECA|nr:hypothetical protein I7I51_07200 [Histoplasma capsulatum]